jgi:protein gp37
MTTIEWTDETWNFLTGCTMGCGYCYAAKIAKRFWGDRPFTDIQFHPERLEQPRRWKKPRKVFVNSMGDWADPTVQWEWLDQGIKVMQEVDRHQYQMLTKFPDIAANYLSDRFASQKVPKHIWLGVSVENQVAANARLDAFKRMAGFCHAPWVSYEPALGPVDWSGWEFIKWMVIGGSSDTEPFDLKWGRGAIEWCREHGIKVFMKQVGRNPADFKYFADPDTKVISVEPRKFTGKGGNPEEWPHDIRLREYPIM